MSFDQIADMLTRIRNAQMAKKEEVIIPASNFKLALAKKMNECGYIGEVKIFFDDKHRFMKIRLKYINGRPVISGIERVSRQGQRIYVNKNKLPRVKNGFGVAIISTSKGVLTDQEARQQKIGGEVICKIW